MTRTILAAAGACAVAATVTLAAQTPTTPPSPTQPPSAAQPRDKEAGNITVTGCLKSWDDAMASRGAPGTPSAAAPAARFVLTSAEEGMGTRAPSATSPSTTTPPATGTPAPTPAPTTAAAAKQQYIVTADTGVNLSAHLNHQVRITGKKSDSASASMPATRPADPAKPGDPTKPSPMGAEKSLPTIAASAVTMISATCPAGTQ